LSLRAADDARKRSPGSRPPRRLVQSLRPSGRARPRRPSPVPRSPIGMNASSAAPAHHTRRYGRHRNPTLSPHPPMRGRVSPNEASPRRGAVRPPGAAHLLVERQIRDQLLQPLVLLLRAASPLYLPRQEPTILLALGMEA